MPKLTGAQWIAVVTAVSAAIIAVVQILTGAPV